MSSYDCSDEKFHRRLLVVQQVSCSHQVGRAFFTQSTNAQDFQKHLSGQQEAMTFQVCGCLLIQSNLHLKLTIIVIPSSSAKTE